MRWLRSTARMARRAWGGEETPSESKFLGDEEDEQEEG
jgi:hypothetical protein